MRDVELLKASREMGFGDNWRQAQEKVKQSFVPEGYQPEAMLKLYEESVDFLKKNDIEDVDDLEPRRRDGFLFLLIRRRF